MYTDSNRPDFYSKNPVLVDMKRYWKQRQSMNNPKDYHHVERVFISAYTANPWKATDAELKHAHRVLRRLAHLEFLNKNSEPTDG